MSNRVFIFDTTLRDGEQSPGASMNPEDKIRMARQLAKLGVDIIEAGFPIASEGDFEATQAVARSVRGPMISAFSRTSERDIEWSWEAIRDAERPLLHVFIATSDIHMQHKLRMTPDQVLAHTKRAVTQARGYTGRIEFSAEDATRSDREFLTEVLQTALDAGATVLNIPDTVGYTTPLEYADLITHMKQSIRGVERAILSVHCHNDLGLAVANSLMAIKAGARQVECTINGIGERAGNAALEELVMAMRTRPEAFPWATGIDPRQITAASKLLTQITGMSVQANKAIVGANAFAHEAGIHQDGMLKNRLTYEIMTPESVGLEKNSLVLGKHSGRNALRDRLQQLGFSVNDEELAGIFFRFKALADKKKTLFDEDLEALAAEVLNAGRGAADVGYTLIHCNSASGTGMESYATVEMSKAGVVTRGSSKGNGPVDAALQAVRNLTGCGAAVTQYLVAGIQGGTDAQAEVSIRLGDGPESVSGRGADTDIVVASAKAYLNAINRSERNVKRRNAA